MDRRKFFEAVYAPQPKEKPIPRERIRRGIKSGLTAYSGAWTKKQVYHLLRRTTFGFKPADVTPFLSQTMVQSVDAILNVTNFTPAPPLKNYDKANLLDLTTQYGKTWVNAPHVGPNNINGRRRNSFVSWWMELILNQDINIREKMTMFWHNHFATEVDVINRADTMYDHHKLIRSSCLGNFKKFVKDVTIDPGMLKYLNGIYNNKYAPDENYARELQELFTLGKGKDSGYTEDDIKAAARVLTGWRVNFGNRKSYWQHTWHDEDDKQFSAFYGNKVIKGKTKADGAKETDELIDMIFDTNEVAKFICRRLYMFFVYYDIDEDVEQNVITPLAAHFEANNWEIKPIVEKLLKSEHFFDVLNIGCNIKNPLEFMSSATTGMGAIKPETSVGTEKYYKHYRDMNDWATFIQMGPGRPPNVAGWPAYWQSPQYYEIWINSNTLSLRNQISDGVAYIGIPLRGEKVIIEPVVTAKLFPNPEDPVKLMDGLCEHIFAVDIQKSVKDKIITDILLQGQNSNYYWTNIWNKHISDPNDTISKNYVYSVLKALYKHLMNLAEFQLS